MHHDRVHAVSHGERLEVRLDGHREGQFIDEVHGCAGDDRTAAQVLEAEDCGTRKGNVDVMTGGHVMLEIYTYYLDATKKRQIFTVHISYSRCSINVVSCCYQCLCYLFCLHFLFLLFFKVPSQALQQ